jgi:tetratricopeptide (TPR) repeat protein
MRMRHYSLVSALVVAVLIACPSHANDCVRRIASDGPSPRTVALAGGDAWTLLRDYLGEVKKRDLDVSPWKIQVVVQLSGKPETLELGWGKMLTGESAERLWERSLSGKGAESSPDILAQAASSNWDLICVGPKKPAPPPAPPDPHVHQRSGTLSLSSTSGDALVFFKSGVQYASSREYANALKEFKEAERRNPRFPGLLMNIGVTYMQLKDYVRASDYLTRAVNQNPGDASTRLNMACLQVRLGQRDDAIASLAAAKSNGMNMTKSLRNDRDLAPLRGREDFEMLFRTTEK